MRHRFDLVGVIVGLAMMVIGVVCYAQQKTAPPTPEVPQHGQVAPQPQSTPQRPQSTPQPQAPPSTTVPGGTPLPASIEGLRLENSSLKSVVQQQQAVIQTLQKQLAELQTQQASRGGIQNPIQAALEQGGKPASAPPQKEPEKMDKAFFATRLRETRDAAQAACKDVGGKKFQITVSQQGPVVVCEF